MKYRIFRPNTQGLASGIFIQTAFQNSLFRTARQRKPVNPSNQFSHCLSTVSYYGGIHEKVKDTLQCKTSVSPFRKNILFPSSGRKYSWQVGMNVLEEHIAPSLGCTSVTTLTMKAVYSSEKFISPTRPHGIITQKTTASHARMFSFP